MPLSEQRVPSYSTKAFVTNAIAVDIDRNHGSQDTMTWKRHHALHRAIRESLKERMALILRCEDKLDYGTIAEQLRARHG